MCGEDVKHGFSQPLPRVAFWGPISNQSSDYTRNLAERWSRTRGAGSWRARKNYNIEFKTNYKIFRTSPNTFNRGMHGTEVSGHYAIRAERITLSNLPLNLRVLSIKPRR